MASPADLLGLLVSLVIEDDRFEARAAGRLLEGAAGDVGGLFELRRRLRQADSRMASPMGRRCDALLTRAIECGVGR